MKSMVKKVLGIGLFVFAISPACEKHSDRKQSAAQTWSQLRFWGDTIESLHKAGFSLKMYKSPKEAADFLKKLNALTDHEYSLLIEDAWHRSFHWKMFEDKGSKIIKIISDGKDGIRENGDGDDLFIEVTIPAIGPVMIRQKPLPHRGFHN